MVLFAEHHLTTLFFIIRHLLIIISLYTTYWFIAYNIINVATIDIIILIVIGAGAIVGFVKGFIRQLASILERKKQASNVSAIASSVRGE